jgi:ATP-dependent DNA helicase RecQ
MKGMKQMSTGEEMMRGARQILKSRFGLDAFREGQAPIIAALLEGRDVFAVMPTGSGKSLCYQLPGYLLPGTVLIVSPLLSLMEDQVTSLRRLGERRIRALNGMIHPAERKRILACADHFRFLFVSPEMLRQGQVINALRQVRFSLFVIDEAHCISQWGYDFRPDYLHLSEVRAALGNPVCLALTATADRRVRRDIVRNLHLEAAFRYRRSVDRPNITLMVREAADDAEKTRDLLRLLGRSRLPGLVYCLNRKSTERLARLIQAQLGLRTAFYHGGLPAEDRRKIQNQFLSDDLDLVCATSAFGMGINKPDIRLVVHFHYPASLNNYLQEVGRAGRDGDRGLAVLLHTPADDRLPIRLIEKNFPTPDQLKSALHRLSSGELSSANRPHFVETMQQEGVSESAARFILDRAESTVGEETLYRHCLRQIRQRRLLQRRDLDHMRTWIACRGCRREALLRFFDETPDRHSRLCCDHCGARVEDFRRRRPLVLGIRGEKHWRQRLDRLLPARS